MQCPDIVAAIIAIAIVALGVKGFKPEGLPLTGSRSITGKPAKIIGSVCVAFGLLLFLLVVGVEVVGLLVRNGTIPPIKNWFR